MKRRDGISGGVMMFGSGRVGSGGREEVWRTASVPRDKRGRRDVTSFDVYKR